MEGQAVDLLPAPVSLEDRTKDGRFLPGVSGNPHGRPSGSKNIQKELETAIREHIASPNRVARVKRVIDKLLTMAEDGHIGAAKLLLDKIVPNARDEDESGAGSGSTYVFRIENATFAATKQLPQPVTIEAEVIDVPIEETK